MHASVFFQLRDEYCSILLLFWYFAVTTFQARTEDGQLDISYDGYGQTAESSLVSVSSEQHYVDVFLT